MENGDLLKLLMGKLDKLQEGQTDIRERLTRTEGKFDTFEVRQEHHYEQNQSEHKQLVSLYENDRKELSDKIKTNSNAITAIRKTVRAIQKNLGSQKTQLDERKGERRVIGWGWQLIIAVIGGGGLAGVVWLISKLIKML